MTDLDILQNSEDKYKTIKDILCFSPFIVFKWNYFDNNIITVFVSENINQFGYNFEYFNNNGIFFDLIHKDDLINVLNDFKYCFNNKKNLKQEFRFFDETKKDYIWVENRLWIKYNESGEFLYFYGIIHNITEHKIAQKTLIENEIKYQMLVNNSPTGILFININGDIIDVNPSMLSILGSPSAEETKKINIFTFQPLIEVGVTDLFKKCIETGEKISGEKYYVSKWNKEVYLKFTIVPLKNKEGNIIAAETTVENIIDSKKFEEELKQSKDYLDKIINAIPDPIFIKNKQHKWVLLNEAFCNFIGRKKEELIGKSDIDFFPKSEVDVFWENDNYVFETGKENLNEEKFTDINGVTHWILTRKTLYIDPKGEPLIIAVIRDITTRKDIEEKLTKSEELLKKITTAARDAIILAKDDGTILYCNDSIERIFGYKKVEILARNIEILLPPKNRETFRTRYNQFKNGTLQPKTIIETNALKKDETIFPVEVSWSVIFLDEEFHYLAIVRDRTEKVRLEEKLAKELDKLKKLLEFDSFLQSTTDLSLILDTVLVTVTAGAGFKYNRAFILLIEEESDFLKGVTAIGPSDARQAGLIYHDIASQNLTLADLIISHHKNRHNYDQEVNNLIKKIYINYKEDLFFTHLFESKSIIQTKKSKMYPDPYITGILNNNDLTFIPLTVNNLPIGIIIVDNFITHQEISEDDIELLQLYANRVAFAVYKARLNDALNKEIEKTKKASIQITQINNRLIQTEKMAAMGEITSEIAHEIRNPLVSIGGFARSLLKNLEIENQNYDLLRIIADESQRLENILSNVLNYARINKLVTEKRPILDAINQAIKLLEYHKQEKNLDIVIKHPKNDIILNYDYEKFIQIFFNLIKNAMQASDENDKIIISVEQILKKVIIRVKDYGSGIKAEHLDAIFNPFFTTKSQGIGLGLSIVKQIINNHGGEINFITEEGKGTEFVINLDIKE